MCSALYGCPKPELEWTCWTLRCFIRFTEQKSMPRIYVYLLSSAQGMLDPRWANLNFVDVLHAAGDTDWQVCCFHVTSPCVTLNNGCFVALVTNPKCNVQTCISSCCSYCSGHFDAIDIKIVQTVTAIVIHDCANGVECGQYERLWYLKIYATHLFIPTEISSGYVGPSMGQSEFFNVLLAALHTQWSIVSKYTTPPELHMHMYMTCMKGGFN